MSHPVTAWFAAYYLASFSIGVLIVLRLLRALLGGRRRAERDDPRAEIEQARRAEQARLAGQRRRFGGLHRLSHVIMRSAGALVWAVLLVPGRIGANLRYTDTVEQDLDGFARHMYAHGHRLAHPLCLVTPLTVHWLCRCGGCGAIAHLVETTSYDGETELRVVGGRLYQAQQCTAAYLPRYTVTPRRAARPVHRVRPRPARPAPSTMRPRPAVTGPSATPPLSSVPPAPSADADGGPARSASA